MICTRRMDTLNTHIDVSSTAMGTSETHSEKTCASDEEDFKLNIPYFEKTNVTEINYNRQAPPQQSTSRNFHLLNRNQNTSPDVDEPNQLNFTNWDNDDMYADDNVSRIGSDYSAQSTSESPNLYPPPHYYGSDPNAIDIKYPPSELILQPPSRYTSLQFEMQQHQHQQQQQQQQQRRHLQPLPPPHLQHLHPALQHRHQHHPQYGGVANGNPNGNGAGPSYPNQQHPGFQHHPNMWYPNAPYGSSRYNCDPQRYPFNYNPGYGHDPMMDMLQLSNSGREARNRAEKNRRDKLNGSIQELSTMVPHVAESPRRVDKTAVLRFASHGLRLKYVFGETLQERTQLTDPLMKLLDSFFITLTCHGQIVLISSSIEQHLGHCQADLYGQSILHITHPEDHNMLKHQLIPSDLENLFDVQPEDDTGEPRPRTKAEEDLIDKKLREDKRSFTVRLARAGPRSEPTAYEVVRIDGCFRRSDAAPRGVKNNPFPSTLQLIRRSRGRDDSIPLHAISGNDIVLIGIARIIRPPKVVNRIMETNSLEYKTRHLIDGRIIDCDQRIGIVAGYMTDEVRNLSPFTFMHQDDARWVIVALRQMYDCNSSYGESTYRLLSRNGAFIYLQSRGYLEIDKNTNKVHSFVCINTLLSEEEGKRRVEEMKRKFSIIINTQIPPSSSDAPASENPQQLVKAVMHLIQNLQKSSDDEENSENDNDSSQLIEDYIGSRRRIHKTSISSSANSRASKTPPALVPPEAASVKSSISKSVSVVNITAARHLRGNQRLKSPISTTEEDDDDDDDMVGGQRYCTDSEKPKNLSGCTHCRDTYNSDELCEYCRRYEYMQNVLTNRDMRKHKLSETISSDVDDEVPQKRRLLDTDNEQILSSPSDQAVRSVESELKDILDVHEPNELYEGASSNQQIIEEMHEEHPNDNTIFVSVKTDYEVSTSSKLNIDSSTTKTSTQQNIKDNDQKQR